MGVLEDIALKITTMERAVSLLAEQIQTLAHNAAPLTADEEVWADGPVTVKEAAEFLRISEEKVAHLIRDGRLASMKDGRRLIAKRGCIRYLLAHQEHASS